MLAILVVRFFLCLSLFLSVSVAHWRVYIERWGWIKSTDVLRIYVGFYPVGPIRAGLLTRGRHVFLSIYSFSFRPELILESAQCHR